MTTFKKTFEQSTSTQTTILPEDHIELPTNASEWFLSSDAKRDCNHESKLESGFEFKRRATLMQHKIARIL